jgi:FeS assembly protein SufD
MALEQSVLSLATVEALSQARGEPDWLRKHRLEAWSTFETLPMPGSRYTHIRGLELSEIVLVGDEAESPTIPKELHDQMAESGTAAGFLLQIDGHTVQAELSPAWKKKGVLFMDITRAIAEHPDLVRRHVEQLERPSDKMDALRRALFTTGLFLYVPQGVVIEQPLKAIQRLTRSGVGLFTQGFVIAEPESAVTYLEELDSPRGEFERAALQANMTRVDVGQGAQVNFSAVQNGNPHIFNFIRRRGRLDQDARLRWTLGWLGGRLTMSHVESVLDGPGAQLEDVQVFFTGGRQHFDLTSNLRHEKPHTKGEVTVKGILKDKSQAVFWGLIRIEPGAQHANAFQSQRSLILGHGPRSNAIPSLEIEANDVRCTHAASASQIDAEQIFYLKSRGLTEDEARKTIVDGFFEPLIAKIPLVQDRLRTLIDRKWLTGV